MNKKLEDYLSLPYPIELIPDESGYVATIPDLPGCLSSGQTAEEAVSGLEEAKRLWIAARLEENETVPEPTLVEDFSGKFVLRIPKTLHQRLDREAKREGISLNTYVLHLLTERYARADTYRMVSEQWKQFVEHAVSGVVPAATRLSVWAHAHGRFEKHAKQILVVDEDPNIVENLEHLQKPRTRYTTAKQFETKTKELYH